MVRSSEQEEGEGLTVVGFVRSAVAAAMSCFFGCFHMRYSNLISTPEPAISRSENVLSSLFISEDESLGKGEECWNLLREEVDFMELKDEAKFLKACGTLPETPAEIRKAWLHNAFTKKLEQEKLSGESPLPFKKIEEWAAGTDSSEDTPSCCMNEYNTRRGSVSSIYSGPMKNASTPIDVCDSENHSATSPVSPLVFAPSTQRKTKSVHFDASAFSSNGTSSESDSQHSKQSGSAGSSSASKPSPYPTPLKITDAMQTPGTVFPSYVSNMDNVKTTRIRSQYVYSFTNLLENPSQSNDESSDSDQLKESLNLNDEASLMPCPKPGMVLEEFSIGEGMKYEASLSSWLKPPSSEQDGNNEQFGSISDENIHCVRTPGERPIVGMVAAHWNGEETSHVSPTMWGGNGIPNSTNKYKEDQRVCWHATPFEERLEKALSDDTVVPKRNSISGTEQVALSETGDTDTAFSQLQTSAIL